MDETRDWRLYERLIATLEASALDSGLTIIPNAQIMGAMSRVLRQVDVLVDARWTDGTESRLIIDAKKYKDKVDVKDVESFLSMMDDCRATRGRIVCPQGWTPAAERRAGESLSLMLLHADQVDDIDWWTFEPCLGSCSSPKSRRRRKGAYLWDAEWTLAIDDLWAIVFTGKCDACHEFHVWCWDCSDTFAVPNEGDHTCDCGRVWASPVEEEIDDPTGQALNAVHLLVAFEGGYYALDRRPLR